MQLLRPILVAVAALVAAPSAHAQSAWDPAPWVEDVEAMRAALNAKYANRAWLEQERGVEIDSLFDRVARLMQQAGSDATARALLDQVIRRIGDGHVRLEWPRAGTRPATPDADRDAPAAPRTAQQFCRAQGYADGRNGGGIADRLPGYAPLADDSPFPAGTVAVAGKTLGVIRIGEFAPNAFPAICEQVVADHAIPLDRPCDDACAATLITEAYRGLTRAWMARLTALREAGASGLLVDITGNGGGSEWAEALARTLSARRLVSERLGFVRGPHWARQWASLAETLRQAREAGADRGERAELEALIAQAEAARASAAAPCDGAPGCDPIGRAGYATGLVGSAPDGAYADSDWGGLVFSAGQSAYPYRSGAWDAPVIVLTDDETWSAAEEFAAVLQDNRAALILGGRTGGAGCGYTWGGTPTTLPHSGAVLQLPDCVRFRADGSNEVRGILPDLTLPWRHGDGVALRLELLGAALPEALRRATALYAANAR